MSGARRSLPAAPPGAGAVTAITARPTMPASPRLVRGAGGDHLYGHAPARFTPSHAGRRLAAAFPGGSGGRSRAPKR